MGVELSVEYNIQYPVNEKDMPITIVKFFDLQSLALSYQKNIKVYQEDRESTIINISLLTEDEKKELFF